MELNLPGERRDVDERLRLELSRSIVYRICTFDNENMNRNTERDSLPDRTSRPSASVLSISTDLPFMAYTLRICSQIPSASALHATHISPGLFAAGPGMFSVSGVSTTRLMLVERA